ncbi:MAG: RagB/SusD family nutrient uptake outer membrane protein [Gemmatimonadota bacterium]|nr:RagB/SusD family nutrient uptake outer membrane protein [Gemmatimonadota bacterium]HEU4988834.1 RagB/SusD family nutrient uptake outer membrane protein [Gemmatimonadaceae bacterium]
MHDLFRRGTRIAGCALAAVSVALVTACHDILQVQNPQAFTNEAANNPNLLPAVAAGAEGQFQLSTATFAIMTGMLSDELQNTSTWIDWKQVSDGDITKNWPTAGAYSGAQDGLLRARFDAISAADRFHTVMGDSVRTSPLFIQVEITRAWADLMLAMGFCETPPGPGMPTVSDTAMFQQARDSLKALLPLIQAAHFQSAADRNARLNFANAGLARASLMLGNYGDADTYAKAVTPGFEYDAIYSTNSGSQNNNMTVQGTFTNNRSYTIRNIWDQYVDTLTGFMRDPLSGQDDPRIPLGHDNNNATGKWYGADGISPFYSMTKYINLNSPIPITNSAEMILIEAEVAWHGGDYATAVSLMNKNREAVGLPDLTVPATDPQTGVFNMLLQERFATMFAQGDRLQDIYRFGLMGTRVGHDRPLKLPLSYNEEQNNRSIGPGGGKCPGRS